jgi:hypothetical protein
VPARRRASFPLFGADSGDVRVEEEANRQLVEHLLRATDVVPLRMRKHDGGETPHTEAP